MMPLKTIIVDDEPDSVKLLQIQLQKHCPQVHIVGAFTSSVLALEEIEKLKPDLLFLDIEMPVLNGFELLEKVAYLGLNVVFVTAYNQFALKAFRFNALDYLVKPIDVFDLTTVVAKAAKNSKPTQEQLAALKKQLQGEPVTKIAIPSQNGITFVGLDEIIYVEAVSNYSKLFLIDKRTFLVSKTLKDVQEVLENSHFLRIHRQYIVNLNHVKQLNKNDGVLTIVNGMQLPVSRNQKDALIERYKLL